ncbi:putative uncharacterized protein [Clostridium sp. CAG:306]|nr:putative uncharacterized protein [Clostridium sp. CAG:306]
MPENKHPENKLPENKLQIRAKLLSAIINMQNNSQDRAYIKKTLEELNAIVDKDAVLDILNREFLKENSQMRDYTITFLISELTDPQKAEAVMFETLANPKIKDSVKAKAVGFLREAGKHVNYEQYINYFENPDEIIDADTVKLLENARVNPESQIDFLDFLEALPQAEKEMLVESLTQDYDGDNLANILIPIIYANPYGDISQIAISAIGESKSMLAYPVLKWLEENIDDLRVKANVQKSLSLLKLSGIKEDITKEYYKRLLSGSPVYKCFVNFPDGHGNIGLIFSRKNEASFIQMFALVLNDIDGIIDCFGFNEISEGEFDRIVNKFFSNDRVVLADETLCKYLMVNAEKISRLKFQEISYEYAAWASITRDIDYEDLNLSDGLSKIELNDFLLKQLYDKGYFEKWFFSVSDNEKFAALIDKIADDKICDIKQIETLLNENMPQIFDDAFLKILNRRLLLAAHFARLNEEQTFADMLYSLIDESECKNCFKEDMLKKSIYEYFLSQKDRYESIKSATSIFARRANKDLQEIDIKYVENCIKEIEKNWV